MGRTNCFAYEDDNKGEVRAAHRNSTVDQIAELAIKYPSLLIPLSNVLSLVPTEGEIISEILRDTYGGNLTSEQEELAGLIDLLYATSRQDTLDARRGVVLERIVLKAVQSRVLNPRTEMVVLNAKDLTLPRHHSRINGYSVDVAACFHEHKRVEFYACKLHAKYMTKEDMFAIHEIGSSFLKEGHLVKIALCCLQRRHRIPPETLTLLQSYPGIELFTVETIPDLMRSPG